MKSEQTCTRKDSYQAEMYEYGPNFSFHTTIVNLNYETKKI